MAISRSLLTQLKIMLITSLGLCTQVRGTIQRIQLDDQMLMAAHPVVLAPSGVAHAQSDGTVWRDLRGGGGAPLDRGSMPIIR